MRLLLVERIHGSFDAKRYLLADKKKKKLPPPPPGKRHFDKFSVEYVDFVKTYRRRRIINETAFAAHGIQRQCFMHMCVLI